MEPAGGAPERTCRQVDGHELLSAQHGDGAGGEAPEDVHVGGHVQEGVVAEGGEEHRGAERLCRRRRRSDRSDLRGRREAGRHSREAGLAVKYLTMERCRDGTLQQQKTSALAAMIAGDAAQRGRSQGGYIRLNKQREGVASPVTVF